MSASKQVVPKVVSPEDAMVIGGIARNYGIVQKECPFGWDELAMRTAWMAGWEKVDSHITSAMPLMKMQDMFPAF